MHDYKLTAIFFTFFISRARTKNILCTFLIINKPTFSLYAIRRLASAYIPYLVLDAQYERKCQQIKNYVRMFATFYSLYYSLYLAQSMFYLQNGGSARVGSSEVIVVRYCSELQF